MKYISTIQELKDNRDEIIETIKSQLVCFDETVTPQRVKEVMVQISHLVTASNYQDLDMDIWETIDESIEATQRKTELPIDMGSINRANAMNNLPSSLR